MSGHSGRCFRSQRRTSRRHRLQRERFAQWHKSITDHGKFYEPRFNQWLAPKSINDVGERFKQMLAENFR